MSAAIVGAWGYFLIQGVRDPLGGVNSLWPLFGIANQLLAGIALSVATTIILKMHGPKFMWITCGPLAWLVLVTFSAGWQKIFSPLPALGFLAQANQLEDAMNAGKVTGAAVSQTNALIFNARLDAAVCGVFMVLVAIVLIDSLRLWYGILRGTQERVVVESPFVVSQLSSEEA
jgi:carbon starvation protein